MGDSYEFTSGWTVITPPVYRWKCTLMEGYVLSSVRAPCAFHRIMQRLAFGFKWERLAKS